MVKGQLCTKESHHIHSGAVLRVKGQECKGANGPSPESNPKCTLKSLKCHSIHSGAVLRVKGQECKGANGQGSIMYNGESSHPFRCRFEGKGSRM